MSKRISYDEDGVQVVADVNVTVAANVGRSGRSRRVSSKQRIVQRDGRTVASEHSATHEDEPSDDRAREQEPREQR